MKRLISILLASLMLFGSMCICSAETPSLDFLVESVMCDAVEQNGTMSIKLNERFGLLELITEDNTDYVSNYIDVAVLVESLFDTTLYVKSKAQTSNDGKTKKTETHIKSNIPFKANANLEGNVKTNYSVWSEFDFSDEENPYFDFVMTHPFASKYITADSEMLSAENATVSNEMLNVYKTIFDSNNMVALNDKVIASMEKNAVIAGNSKNVKVTFTDLGLKMFIMDVLVAVLEEIDESMLEGYDEEAVETAFKTVPVFGKDALVMEYTLDSKGRISKDKTTLNVDLNIYDLMMALGEEEPPEETGITREVCRLNFTINAETEYNYSSVAIERPELTEENSVDIFEYEDPYYYDEPIEDDDYSWIYSSVSVDIDENCIENNEIKYVCLRDFMDQMGYYVAYENGRIFGETDNPYAKYKALNFSVGGDVAYTDVEDVVLDEPVFVIDGISYISLSDCEKLTGYKSGRYSHYDLFWDYGYVEFATEEYYNTYYGG